jgi:nucleotide-binding universal stress UspA family protein
VKILFATDGTKQSDSAVETLEKFALSEGDEIRIISVIDMAVPTSIDIFGGYLPDTTELEKTARENATRILDETAKRIESAFSDNNVTVATDVLFGTPESRIVETAEEMGCDLIIVGSHGYSRWERLLLGSVSNSVVQHAPCSVLVVRSPKQ